MNLNNLKKFFNESNGHGFSLILKTTHHPIERLLWTVVIGTSIYFGSNVYRTEYKRYEENSIASFIETNYRSWEYISPGLTLCTNYINHKRVDDLVEKSLRISKSEPMFYVYKKFVEVVTLTTYENLQQYSQFMNNSFLDGLDMLQIAKEMREYLLPQSGFNVVITEMGICFSSTYLHQLQNASDRIVSTISDEGDICRSTLSQESCNKRVFPVAFDENNKNYIGEDSNGTSNYIQTLFIHNKDDVMNPTKPLTLDFILRTVRKVELKISATVSSNKLKQLALYQRKCIFEQESPLKYYKIYTTSLCLISCRINSAVKLCGCIPFFYKINSTDHRYVPSVCSIQGMVCLSKKMWFEKVSNYSWVESECKCLPLCSSYEFQKAAISYKTHFEVLSSIEISVIFPKRRTKRGVVYSTDNLLVSIGGAVGLYLGCSFISVVEIIFFMLEMIIEILADVYRFFKLKLLQ